MKFDSDPIGEYGRESALARGMATSASRPRTASSASGSAGAALVHVGTAGWSYSDWEGVFYPRPHPRGFDPLEYLSRYVDVVEVNSTFYRPVDADVARYIGDARAQELPLLGGEDSIHDWWYLLINWDLLPRDLTIARWVHFAGAVAFLTALIGGGWYARGAPRNGSET